MADHGKAEMHLQGRNRWIEEGIVAFLKLPRLHELVDIAGEMEKLNKTISIRLPEELDSQIKKALIDIRKKRPELEGVKSNIIRASIIQRLL